MRLPSADASQKAKLRDEDFLPASGRPPRGAFGSHGTRAIVRWIEPFSLMRTMYDIVLSYSGVSTSDFGLDGTTSHDPSG